MNKIPILTYHSLDDSKSVVSVSPKDFANQMTELAEMGIRGISLREAVSYRKAHGCWPEGCVVLTFDDGYANFYEGAMPVFMRHKFTATIYVVTGHVGGRNNWAAPPPGLGQRQMLCWRQLEELAAAGIEIGAHTKTHPDLRSLSGPQIEEEITGACAEIEERLEQPVESFAYPYGYFGQTSLTLVKQKFSSACTTLLGRARDNSLYMLPRVDMYYINSQRHLQQLITGGLDWYLAVRRWGRALRSLLDPNQFLAESTVDRANLSLSGKS